MKTVHIAIAGFGKGGQIYNAPIISSVEGMKIIMVQTASAGNIEAAKRNFPEVEIVHDYEELLSNRAVDLIVITTPNHMHTEYVKNALQAGKHVVVEKPFTPSSQEADELIALAKEKNLLLSVHHNRRWDTAFLTVKKLLREEKLGKVVEYEAHFDRFRTEVKEGWKEDSDNPGSGILYDLGSHLIDQALVLFGNPEEVFADIRIQRENAEVPDNFELLLFYPTTKVTLKAGMLVREKGPTYIIHGSKGSFVKYGDDPQEEKMKAGLKPKDIPNWGIEPEETHGKLNTVEEERIIESERGNYTLFYQNIYDVLNGKAELEVRPEQARDVIKVIEAARRSNEEKCRVRFLNV